MKVLRDAKGNYFLQPVPEENGVIYLYSLDINNSNNLVDNKLIRVEDATMYTDITELDFAATKSSTPQLMEELRTRKDNPFDYDAKDVIASQYLIGYFTDDERSINAFDVEDYAASYKQALHLAENYTRKPTIIKDMSIVVQMEDDLLSLTF